MKIGITEDQRDELLAYLANAESTPLGGAIRVVLQAVDDGSGFWMGDDHRAWIYGAIFSRSSGWQAMRALLVAADEILLRVWVAHLRHGEEDALAGALADAIDAALSSAKIGELVEESHRQCAESWLRDMGAGIWDSTSGPHAKALRSLIDPRSEEYRIRMVSSEPSSVLPPPLPAEHRAALEAMRARWSRAGFVIQADVIDEALRVVDGVQGASIDPDRRRAIEEMAGNLGIGFSWRDALRALFLTLGSASSSAPSASVFPAPGVGSPSDLRVELRSCARAHGDQARAFDRGGRAGGAAELRRVENLLWALARGEPWSVVLGLTPDHREDAGASDVELTEESPGADSLELQKRSIGCLLDAILDRARRAESRVASLERSRARRT